MGKSFKRHLSVLLTAFLLFFLSASSFTAVSAKENPSNTIYLNGITIKTHEKIDIPDELKKEYSSEEIGPYIVSFNGPVYESMKTKLKKAGAELVEYIPDFSFLTLMTPEVAQNVKNFSFVNDIIVYQPAFKINTNLKNILENIKNNTEMKINILTFDDSSLDNEIADANGEKLNKVKNKVIAKIKSSEIFNLAKLNSVKYIELAPEFKLCNDVARGYMGVNDLSGIGYNGDGQVVGVCDTGLDTGSNDSSMHLDFQGRINSIFALGRSTADDPHGHGTHVSGSVLGNGARSNGQYKGTAPEASLVMQSVLDSNNGLGGLPDDLNTLFAQSYNAGARIHTNSWGAAVSGQYDTSAQQVDQYVWNNDMIILFAAGNEGGDSGNVYNSISSPGTAKNCITVGASENYRPTMPNLGWGNISDNPNQIAPFSSRGNCSDGRTKPDIVAPGTWILSTKSSSAPSSNFWGSFNNYYAYMGGTSMATPLTAGAVAVAREYMQKTWNHTPSPAMMKAAIINGGTDLSMGFPSRDQGWGRINLADSLLTKEYKYDDESVKLSTGQSQDYTYTVESQNTPLKLSLVWTDYPGSTSASKALVNDLDLKVTSPSGSVYYGNDFTSPYDSSFDRLNNVENIFINTPEVGNYTIEVKAYNVPDGPQDFALFSSGNFDTGTSDIEPPTCNLTSPSNNDTVTGTVALSADASDNTSVNRVEFYVDGTKIGTDAQSPYSVEWNSTSATNGSHNIQAKAFDAAGNMGESVSIAVTVNNTQTDTTLPSCSITAPQSGASINGTISINADASDNVGISKVEFYIDGTKVGEDAQSPYSIDWDSTSATDGNHSIQAKAFDAAGNMGESVSIAVTVNNTQTDTTLPSCSITAPQSGASINGTISINADASDNVGISKVEFYIDGTKVGEDAQSPYSIDWDSTSATDGNHSIQAKAFDAAGNMGESQQISVTVNNTVKYETKTFTGNVFIIWGDSVTINVTAHGTIDLNLSGGEGLSMKLYNPSGKKVASGTDTINYNATQTGTYTIDISTSNFEITDYSLTATYPVQ